MAKVQTEGSEAPAKPRKQRAQPTMTGSISFFQRVARVAKDDWGTRASIKVYRLEPVLNLLLTQDHKFVTVYEQDGYTVNEDRLKHDCGSGRYKLYLNYKGASETEGREVDSIVLDILDPEFPPNIPAGTWLDHPKNKNWMWAKEALEAKQAKERLKNAPPAAPAPPTPMGEVAQMFDVVDRIHSRNQPEQQQQLNVLDVIRGVKEIMPPPPAASADNGLLNSVVTLLTTQMQSQALMMQKQMEDARAESRELRDEVRRARDNPATNKTGFDMFKEGLELFKGVAPSIKEIFPGLKEVAGGSRSKMGGWQEFLVQFGQPIISDIINSPVTNALGQLIVMKATQPAATNGTTAPTTQHNPALPAGQRAGNLVDFFNQVWPFMLRYLKEGWTGDEFAAWLWDGYGCPYNGVDWLSQGQVAGAVNIVTAFKGSPFWPQISVLPNGEQVFGEFVTSFVAWTPPNDEDIQEGETSEVVDLTAESRAM